jgi:hypothetical protein
MVYTCSSNRDTRNVYILLEEKPLAKLTLGTTRRSWINNIKIDHKVRLGVGRVANNPTP